MDQQTAFNEKICLFCVSIFWWEKIPNVSLKESKWLRIPSLREWQNDCQHHLQFHEKEGEGVHPQQLLLAAVYMDAKYMDLLSQDQKDNAKVS